jgi:diguanylate cyclase (GGDEF)-like protein
VAVHPSSPRAPLRTPLAVAAALMVAGAAIALAAGRMPGPLADVWTLVRVATQLIAIAIVVRRVQTRDEQRAGWMLIAVAAAAWTGADVVSLAGDRELPGHIDMRVPFWLSSYLCLYAGLALLTRPLLLRAQAAVWLDGLSAALAVAAVLAVTLHGILGLVGARAGHRQSEVVINLIYPVADFVLVGMALAAYAVTGWRPPAAWRRLALGMLGFLAADVWYFAAWASDGYSYGAGAPVEAVWCGAFVWFALAAWRGDTTPAGARARLWTSSGVPVTVLVVATAVLMSHAWDYGGDAAGFLAAGAVLAVAVRIVLTTRELSQLALSRREALTDELTGLGNRRQLLRRTGAACAADEPRAALLLCDLDGFKEFNDTLGHEAGDELLREAAARIRRVIGDCGEVARLGGDEFAVLSLGAGREQALDLAAAVRRELALPLPVAGIAVRVEASIGVALLPEHSRAAAGLLRRADVAMYAAKASRTGVEVYDAGRDLHSRERLVLAGELREAVEQSALEVHFQPKATVGSGKIVAAEALVRWPHPERGLLFPDAFLPAAEQAGLMRPLTLVVLERALAACGRWTAAGRDLGVAVNLSASNLLDASLPDEVAALLERHGVAPCQLTLEVTEGTILANPVRSGEVLAAVRGLGVAVSLDDFGTGHSSLSHVKRLPVDELKIDRSFVTDLTAGPTDRAIVASIVRLAHSLGMTVTAEGVETDEALAVLREERCDLAQGFLFSRPLPEDDFAAWLAARESTPEVVSLKAALQPQHGLRVEL